MQYYGCSTEAPAKTDHSKTPEKFKKALISENYFNTPELQIEFNKNIFSLSHCKRLPALRNTFQHIYPAEILRAR